ncbi:MULTISPECIES: RusA family crossover junction endodeoxyribonuclease [unclassified Nonomuraea]|uniref:RusA family crossover junction endodeoxyribonuclease n=1 Tax=unclassified Nonomuraea TaxID=2593643 RepID=UPI00341137C3
MTRLALTAVVYGVPAPQGSKKANPIYRGSAKNGTRSFTGRVTLTEMSKKVAPWREAVRDAVRDAIGLQSAHALWEGVLAGPVEVRVTFALPRGKSVRRPWPITTPDLDKVVRATMDGITMGGAWADDKLAVRITTDKVYAGTPGALERPGAVIDLWALDGVVPEAHATIAP